MNQHKRIYLACPYSHAKESVRIERFEMVSKVAGHLMKKGYHVFSPISHTHPIALLCDLPLGFEFWNDYDLSFIDWCNELWILTLRGWSVSNGIQEEIKYAKKINKPVRKIDKHGVILH